MDDTTNNEDEEIIDLDLINQILDHMSAIDKMDHQSKSPSNFILDQVKRERNTDVINLISKLGRSTYWANASEDNTDRPQICFNCTSNSCEHTDKKINPIKKIDDLTTLNCDHDAEDKLPFNGICMDCILNSSAKLLELSDNELYYIWDTLDLAIFNSWMTDSSIQFGISN